MTTVPMELIEHEGYVEARYLGTYSLAQYLQQMELSVQSCLERGFKHLLVDVTDLSDYRPTTMERYQIGELGARISTRLTKVAALILPQQRDKDDFAVTVAQNRGLSIRIFTDRQEAISWLLK